MEFDDSSKIINLPPAFVPKRDAEQATTESRANIPPDALERPMPAIPPGLPASLLPPPPPPVALSLPPPPSDKPLSEPLSPLAAAEGGKHVADDRGIASEERKTAKDSRVGQSARGAVLSKKGNGQPAKSPRDTPSGALVFLGLLFGTVISVFIIVAAISGEKDTPAPVASQPTETPAPTTPSPVGIYVDTPPPTPPFHSNGDRPPLVTPTWLSVSVTPYPATPYSTPTYTYVRPTASPATPALKIARTYAWRNAKYAIPQDRLSDFNAIKNAGLARMKSVEQINKQLDGLPAQIAKASGREKTRLLQLESNLRVAGDSEIHAYQEIATRMDDFMGRLETDHPECIVSGRGLTQQ